MIRITAVDLADPAAAGFRVAGNVVPGRYVAIEVIDSGCGMSDAIQAEDLRAVFHDQVSRTRAGAGRGCRNRPRSQLGNRLKSAPGEGSTFQVFLPAAATETRRSDRSP